MRSEHDNPMAGSVPSLSELLEGYVNRQVGRFQAGVLSQDSQDVPDLGGEVSPHDAVPVQAVDARLAWDEALASLALAGRTAPSSPPEWKLLVTALEPALDLAFCAGNFPQMVRNLSLLLQDFAQRSEQKGVTPPRALSPGFDSAPVIAWADGLVRKPFPQPLLAAGVLRLAHEFDRARDVLRRGGAAVPREWQAAWQNEEAALAWHSGHRPEAADRWQTHGAADHVPTLFNRGMAALFLSRPGDARAPLTQAIARIPEDNSWHHLARLYLTLAEMRTS